MKNLFFRRLPLYYLFAGSALVAAADQSATNQVTTDKSTPTPDAFDRYFKVQATLKKNPTDQSASTEQNPPKPSFTERYFDFHKVSDDDDWTRHFRIGAVVGLNISANFKENGLFKISGNGAANGTYDDGYVREDQTGNAGGYTSDWGYNNASQYNAATHTLTMHSATSYSTSGSSSDDGGPFPGFELAYGANLFYWKHIRVGWELGFDLMPMSISDNHSMSAMVNQTDYTFNTGGIVLPGAPYHGGSSGQGPLLPGTPTSVTSQPYQAGTVTGTRKLDMMLYAIRLGPSFYWDLSQNVSMSVGAGPALGIVSAEYKYDEIVSTGGSSGHNVGSFDGMDVVFGGDFNATLMYHTQDKGKPVDLYISAQYMPLGSADFSNGGREGRLNLEGQVYLSAGINWPF